MAVLITASEDSGINLANVVFESLLEYVVELRADITLIQALRESRNQYLLNLNDLTLQQREQLAQGISSFREKVEARDGVHLSLLAHLDKVRTYVLTEGVQK